MFKQCYICDSTDAVRMENKIWLCLLHRHQYAKNLRTLAEAKLEAATAVMTAKPLPPVLSPEQKTDPLPEPVKIECRSCYVPKLQWELNEFMRCDNCSAYPPAFGV